MSASMQQLYVCFCPLGHPPHIHRPKWPPRQHLHTPLNIQYWRWRPVQPQLQPLQPSPRHHQPIVRTVLDGRVDAGDPKLPCHLVQSRSDTLVCCHTSCYYQAGDAGFTQLLGICLAALEGTTGALCQETDAHFLKLGSNACSGSGATMTQSHYLLAACVNTPSVQQRPWGAHTALWWWQLGTLPK